MYNIKAPCHRSSDSAEPPSDLPKTSSYLFVLQMRLVSGKGTATACDRRAHVKEGLSFTGRGIRAWTRGSPACRAASRSCRGRRWPRLSEQPVHSWTPLRRGGPQCWRGTRDWRLRLPCRPDSLQKRTGELGSVRFSVRG